MEEIGIRPAQPHDLPAVSDLLVETWHDTYDPLIGADRVTEITNVWHSVQMLGPQLAMPETAFLIAERGNQLVGHVFANAQRMPVLAIARLYVLPGFQRRGIGSALVDAALDRFPISELVSLEVEADNSKGLAFYWRVGFVTVDARVVEGIRHIRLEKHLT